jgi:hypothetical protein
MHSTIVASNAGQLRGCTSFGASISMAIETPNFTMLQNKTALAPGDTLVRGLLIPRAIKAPGNTTTAAPYSAELNQPSAAPACPHSQANDAATTPTAACTAITHHGDTRRGLRATRSRACSRVRLVNSAWPSSSAHGAERRFRADVLEVTDESSKARKLYGQTRAGPGTPMVDRTIAGSTAQNSTPLRDTKLSCSCTAWV